MDIPLGTRGYVLRPVHKSLSSSFFSLPNPCLTLEVLIQSFLMNNAHISELPKELCKNRGSHLRPFELES